MKYKYEGVSYKNVPKWRSFHYFNDIFFKHSDGTAENVVTGEKPKFYPDMTVFRREFKDEDNTRQRPR